MATFSFKTFSFKTTGCRLNQSETALMRGKVIAGGGKTVEFGHPCDVCIIHGCVVTSRAEKNTWRLARAAKRAGFADHVVVAGCPAELAKRFPIDHEAVLLLDQTKKFDIAGLCARLSLPYSAKTIPETPAFDTTRALVRIQNGCDFFCAYCIVPYTRGRSHSRPMPEIIAEIRQLADEGYKEVVLTGANIGCYEWGGKRLAQLIEAIEKQTSLPRIRLSSIELSAAKRDIIEIIDRMADSPRLCRYLHLPLQSGSDSVLKAMRRRYTRGYYAEIIDYASGKLGNPGLGADIIVGFPGETDADFNETARLVDGLPLNNLHVFAYSPRRGTLAAGYPDQIPEPVKQLRARQLSESGRRKRAEFARQWIGKPVEALTEKTRKNLPAAGWTGEYLPIRIPPAPFGKIPPNTIVKCIPHDAADDILLG